MPRHKLRGREAPYPWWGLPVWLGTLGGVGLVVDPLQFFPAKVCRDTALTDGNRVDMDLTFTTTLLPTSLALLALRAMPAMNLLLAEDLGTAFPRFITMPYGKLMRGLYRVVWLVLDDHEMIQMRAGAG